MTSVGVGVGWSTQGTCKKPWSSRWQNFPVFFFFRKRHSQDSSYDKMHAVPIAPEFAQQRCKLPYAGLQPDAQKRATVCRKFVDSKVQGVRHVLGILVVKLKRVGVQYRICSHLKHQVEITDANSCWVLLHIWSFPAYTGIFNRPWEVLPRWWTWSLPPSGITYHSPDDDQPSWLSLVLRAQNLQQFAYLWL